jgi:N-methylhydantoinase B
MNVTADPTKVAILARALHAITEEMGANLIRSAFSTVVREARDCSTALLDAEGNVVAQAEMIPMQTAALSMSFKGANAQLDLSRIDERHAIIMNDPYSGGQHLNDIILFQPIFLKDELLGFAGNTAHHLDIGGGSAGINTGATDLIQEGLVIPPLLFDVERDWNRGILERMIFANIRTAEIGLGDLNAQFAANHTGAERLRELAAREGPAMLRHVMAEAQNYSERRMRAAISEIPDGVYRGEAFVDRDVFEDRPIRIAVAVTVAGSAVELDFAGTDGQVKSMFNCPLSSAHAAAFAAIRSVMSDKDIPANDGCNRPLTLRFPKGSVLNPHRMAPVRARMATAYRAFDAVHAALAQAMPDQVPAQGFNTTTGFYITQQRENGNFRVFVDVLGGGYGACREYDGADAVDNILSNCRNTPVEAIEQTNGHLLMRSYTMISDSGGAGEWRGGLGFMREVEVREDGVFLNLYSDHHVLAPQGLCGGHAGATGSLSVMRGAEKIRLTPTSSFDLKPGDLIKLCTGGGGGYGDPKLRCRDRVERDLEDGRISITHAEEAYGYRVDCETAA